MTKKKILLTGDKWGDRQGTTVEATWEEGQPVYHIEDSPGWACDKGCVCGYAAVEVPYLIGEKVRLTGEAWAEMGDGDPGQGDVVEITGYDKDHDATFEWGNGPWYIFNRDSEDFSAEPVTESGWNIGVEGPVIETGENITDPYAPLPFITPRPDEHPNFVQVSEKVPTLSSEYDKTYSAYREDEYSPWELLSTTIKDATDIKALRKVLDEIERRRDED